MGLFLQDFSEAFICLHEYRNLGEEAPDGGTPAYSFQGAPLLFCMAYDIDP